jgi:hypothetical protein
MSLLQRAGVSEVVQHFWKPRTQGQVSVAQFGVFQLSIEPFQGRYPQARLFPR